MKILKKIKKFIFPTRYALRIVKAEIFNISKAVEVLSKKNNFQNSSNDILKSKLDVCFPVKISGEYYFFYDVATSSSVDAVAKEIEGNVEYDFSGLDLKDGDIILDVGACIGMLSVYLSKKFPKTKIISIEPSERNYANLVKNISINQCDNVIPINCAISADNSLEFVIKTFLKSTSNSQSSISKNKLDYFNIMPHLDPLMHLDELYNFIEINVAKSKTLEDICAEYKISKIKMIKMDCEGAEHEVLKSSPRILSVTENLRLELHGTQEECDKTLDLIYKNMPRDKVVYNTQII